VDVLFTPLRPDDEECPLRILSGLTDSREPVVVVTVTSSPVAGWIGKTCLYRDDVSFRQGCLAGELADGILTDIHQALSERASRSVAYGETRVFIEVLLPAIHIVGYGGNYDIRTLLNQARELGWDSTVVLNTARVDKTLVAAATTVLDNKKGPAPRIDVYTAVLLMSHDYRTDMENLQRVLDSSASYIGLLGPRKRAVRIFEELAKAGRRLGEDELRRIYAPAGLDIGAATPEEIALSMLAEVRGHFAGREGASLRLRQGSIYG
jgi:xanthine/CO dehydrogenase XdhC/CoxF family maturation factor